MKSTNLNKQIEVDEYLETMYNLNRQGWFIQKATENKSQWVYDLTNKEKKKRKLVVKKPV